MIEYLWIIIPLAAVIYYVFVNRSMRKHIIELEIDNRSFCQQIDLLNDRLDAMSDASIMVRMEERERYERLVKKSAESQRASVKGKVSEQLVPYLPGFEYDPADCRFLGSPVDLVIFSGLTRGKVEEIILLEIKTGGGELSSTQRQIRDAVNKGKVKWDLHHVDIDTDIIIDREV